MLLLLLYDLNRLNYCLNPYNPSGLSNPYKVDVSISICFLFSLEAKGEDADQTPRSVASDLGTPFVKVKKNGMLGIKVTKCKYLYPMSCRYIQVEKHLKCRNLNTDVFITILIIRTA